MSRALEYPENVRAIWLETLASRFAGYGVYVFRAGPFLVDAGFHNARRDLASWSGLRGAMACLLTHADEDHSGNADLVAELGTPVLAPPAVIEYLRTKPPIRLYRRLIWGTGRVGEIGEVQDEVAAEGWRLIAVRTPGHSADHFVYWEPDRRVLFSADLYIASRLPVAKRDEDLGQLISSLRTVIQLGPRVMFCSHRGRIERPLEALDSKVRWLEDLVAGAKQLADQGVGVGTIARRLLGPRKLIDFASRGEYSRRNLIEVALRSGGSM